ncbi:MJ0042-type zinc finger domain-containing protein [Asaia sp. VD9]|uniref:MJ0042-type zinc finger domain-containing protein n=1 Tax=Asaia sp. VD9 TaxID=3081235 RepID=UPI0038D1BF54
MVKVWGHGEGDDFTCPHCQARYAVTIMRLPVRERDSATCQKCGKVMNTWNSTETYSYSLIDEG